jgi:Family of unknown function (DUF5677)
MNKETSHNLISGFLSPDLAISIVRIRQQFAPWFQVGSSFSALGMKVLSVLNPDKANNQKLVAAATFGRALTSYQSAYILAERGLLADARTVVRAAAETAIFLSALSQDASVADILIERHFFHHCKLRAAWLDDPQAIAEMTPEQVAAINASIAEIDKEHPNLKRDPLVLSTLAGKGPFIALYNAVYRVASGDAAHVSLDALNRHIRADAAGDIEGLKFGPEVEDLPDTLSIAISILALALYSVLELFSVEKFNDELGRCMTAWKDLGIPSEYKAA